MIMKQSGLLRIFIFTCTILLISIGYFIYVYNTYPAIQENESVLGEIGEGLGELGLWGLVFIYGRTCLKILLGKGKIAKRLVPDYSLDINITIINKLLHYLNKTHIYVGITTIAVILLHITFMGIPMDILFFPAVLALVIWQGLFGLFLTWRYSPTQLKKLSYLVHAQLITGIMIGIFAYFGHLLIDD